MHSDSSVIRCCGRALCVFTEVNIVQSAVGLATFELVAVLAFASLRIVVVVHIHSSVPRSADQVVLLLTPEDQAGNVLVLLVTSHAVSLCCMTSCLVVGWLAESFLFHAVLYIKAVGATTLVTHKKLSLAVIQTDARDVSVRDVSEYVLQASIRSIPDLDASWMSCDESVENRVVQHTETSIFVSEVVVNRFIIVVKHQRSATHNDSLRRCGHSKRIDLIETAVKSLSGGVGSHVPHSNHA